MEWVLGNLWFHVISEIGQKSHSIVELDTDGLIVNGGPVTLDDFIGALLIILTEDCLGFVIIHDVDSVDVFGLKLEMVLIVHNLDSIWHIMGAELLSLE